jgi:hypothetical protein
MRLVIRGDLEIKEERIYMRIRTVHDLNDGCKIR